MRGAGCTINDMWDKDIDAKVLLPREEETTYRDFELKSKARNPRL
jgi:4-hydroxybenzoate polyprenyltransferase